MTEAEALQWINGLLCPDHLTTVQTLIISQVWQGKTYARLAEDHGYAPDYVKGVAAKLWQRLSQQLGERVGKHNLKAVIERRAAQPTQESLQVVDWGEAPALGYFCGRQQELELLTGWLQEPGLRLIGITGLGGIGKTALAVRLAEIWIAGGGSLLWRSLAGQPPLARLLASLGVEAGIPSLWEQISAWLGLLGQRRLVVLDQWERVAGEPDYELLLQRLATERHNSVIVLLSRVKPEIYCTSLGIRCLPLPGLELEPWQLLCCQTAPCQGSRQSWEEFHRRYGGHPLAGLLLSPLVSRFFGGNLAAFLYHDLLLLQPLQQLIQGQVAGVGGGGRWVLQGLVLQPQGLTVEEWQRLLWITWEQPSFWEMLSGLLRWHLVERVGERWQLLPMLRAALQEQLLEELVQELQQFRFQLWNIYCLPDWLFPRLQQRLLPGGNWAARWQAWMHLWRQQHQPGYGSRNWLHWGYFLGVDLAGCDFSGLHFYQARWQGAARVNLQGAHLQECHWLLPWGDLGGLACNGRVLALGNQDRDQIRLWSWPDLDQEQVLPGHGGGVMFLTFVGEETLISYGQDQLLKAWDCRQGSLIWEHWVGALLDWRQQGAKLLTQSQGGSWLSWDGQGGEPVPGDPWLWAEHPDQPLRAYQRGGRIGIEGSWEWAGVEGPLRYLGFGGDWLLAAWATGQMRLWNWRSGYCLREWQAGPLVSITFDPLACRWITYSREQGVCLWDPQGDQPLQIHPVARSGRIGILAADYPHLVTTQGAQLWDWQQGSPRSLGKGEGIFLASSAHAQGWLAGNEGGELHWGQGRDPLRRWQGHRHPVLSVVVGSDWGASSDTDGVVRLWRLPQGTWLADLPHPHPVTAMATNPQQTYLLTGDRAGQIRLWNPYSAQLLSTWQTGGDPIHSLAWGPGWIAAGVGDKGLQLWDPERHQPFMTLKQENLRLRCLAVISQGLASGNAQGQIQLWDPWSGQVQTLIDRHQGWVDQLLVSPDGHYLISSSQDHTLKVWHLGQRTCIQTLALPQPYSGMNISQATGLTPSQRQHLRQLGAIEVD
ncbi:MAG: WD40 repeat domain-containing protein [Thermostichales cyanobacterium BF3_bins_165]